MSLDWNNRDIVNEYARSSTDPSKHWYESEVNIPSILELLGDKGRKVLDFGCGPGDLTARLAKDFNAFGADSSELMVEQARQGYPSIEFFVWDGSEPLPTNVTAFDSIVSKLTIEFVSDLAEVAINLHRALVKGGSLIISVAHPMLVAYHNPDDPYWEESTNQTQIGTTGVVVTKIQRSLQDYINPFLEAGFTIARIDEPEIPPSVIERYDVKPLDRQIPKRLNVKFIA
ncbi:MAG TPA: class I SAM-dependent methyltransferase [Candidatus Saccharimonadia bacterium]|nr:class I SAM-dependent methyltransferase [Candidatus Saccharimonadia bacterium]